MSQLRYTRMIVLLILVCVGVACHLIWMSQTRRHDPEWDWFARENLRAIGLAMEAYCADYGGYLPPVRRSREWPRYLCPDYLRPKEELLIDGRIRRDLDGIRLPSLTTSYLFNLDVSGKQWDELEKTEIIVFSELWSESGKGRYAIKKSIQPCLVPISGFFDVKVSREPIEYSGEKGGNEGDPK